MPLQFFDTLSRQIEVFEPWDPSVVRLYTCGPTVYDHAHIGNFRAYVFEDLLQRHLEYRGFNVHRVMNLTDVDDKTIRRSREQGISLDAFTAPFKAAFFEDLDALRIKRANSFPEATAHVPRMIEMIQILLDRGHAYQADDRSIYFRISSFADYGKLAHLDLNELRPSGRISNDEYEKENVGDFALWKAWDANDGDVAWDSPWGRGRPGWHIECSAMATEMLGDQVDIHCGGEDNIFPHHEAEIAQTECCTGRPFVKYWLHCRHLLVDGQKMSKSAGNFFTLRNLIENGATGREVRYALLAVRYREPLNFTKEGLEAARSALVRLDEWQARLAEVSTDVPPEPVPASMNLKAFGEALDNDLNISAALAAVFDVIHKTHRLLDSGSLSPGMVRTLLDWNSDIQTVLALEPEEVPISPEVQAILDQRAAARAARDWAASDQLRDRLAELGWAVKDTKDGQKLKRS